MGKQKAQGFFYGTIILTAGTAAVKLIGVLFKIPLTNLLGGVGMGYFNVAYDLYYPLYALFVAGAPVAVSKLVSESVARRRMRDAKMLLRSALELFAVIGAVGSGCMFWGAQWFAQAVKNPQAAYAVKMLAPAIFFGCVMSALRGYWQGMQDMRPTAVSQVVEAAAKLVLGLAFSYGALYWGMQQYQATGMVFGNPCANNTQAQMAVLPYAAAGAVLGVSCSMACGTAYMLFFHRSAKGGISEAAWRRSPPAEKGVVLKKRLLRMAAPVCLAAMVTNFTSLIDLVTVMDRLASAVGKDGSLIEQLYQGAIPTGVGRQLLPAYLYGCYSGLAVPVYNLVPSLVSAIGVSLLPAVAAAWAVGDKYALERDVSASLRLASVIAMPAGLGICALAGPILELLYFSRGMEVAVIWPALRFMGVSAVFVALTLPMQAILQAVGRPGLPVKLMAAGGVMKLGCNYILVAVPALNIRAAPIGTLVCYAFVLLMELAALVRETGVKIQVWQVFGKPLFAAVCCALAAHTGQGWLAAAGLPQAAATLAGIAIGGMIYLVLVLFTKTLLKSDFSMVPGAEKFVNLLEKYRVLG